MTFWDEFDDSVAASKEAEQSEALGSSQDDTSGVCQFCGFASDDVLIGVCRECADAGPDGKVAP